MQLPCPSCDSSDAYAIDDQGWGNCFSCHKRRYEGDASVKVTTKHKGYTMKHNLNIEALPERKLSLETCKFYGVGYRGDDLFFPINDAMAYKVRINGKKQFKIEGNFAEAKQLFGQDKFAEGGKFVVVTEGEFDAMSFYQMSGRYNTPSVSVRNGAQSAVTDIKNNFEYLNSFETIILWFDSDDAGKEAASKCADILGGKAKIVQPSSEYKDANDYLIANKSAEAMKQFWNAKPYTPEGIINGKDLYDLVMQPMEKPDHYYPFKGLNELTYGIRSGELITLTAGSGLGKSQLAREIIYHILVNSDENVGMLFMEENVRKTGLSIMSLNCDKPLHLPTTIYTQEEKDKAFDATLGTGRVWLFDHFGSNKIDNIISRLEYMAKVLECKRIVLDHFNIIVSSGENGTDERKVLDELMTKLRTFVERTGVTLFGICHLARAPSGSKSHEEGGRVSLGQLRGSGGIAQLSDIAIGLERNQQSDDNVERHTTTVRILKNRFSGDTGKACQIMYNKQTGRMVETFEDEAL